VQYTEVEQKYRLLSDPATLKATLTDRGAKPGAAAHQVDSYFNAPHRGFLADTTNISEWLRVRVEDDHASLNYKLWHPLGQARKTHCDEYESPVGDPEAIRLTLAALGFTELTVVDKTREAWHLNDIEVAFDDVIGLGTFIEFEFKGDADNVEDATARITDFIDSLDIQLGERIHAGYPHMILGLHTS
jgi:adenylate cyclase class 2